MKLIEFLLFSNSSKSFKNEILSYLSQIEKEVNIPVIDSDKIDEVGLVEFSSQSLFNYISSEYLSSDYINSKHSVTLDIYRILTIENVFIFLLI